MEKSFSIRNTNFFNPTFTSFIVGSTRSGKSTFLNKYVPEMKRHYDIILLFSNSVHSSTYNPIKKLSNVIYRDHFIPELIQDFYKIQKKTNNFFSILVILDDEITSKNISELVKLFCIYRNSGFSTIFAGQEFKFLNKAARNNINYLILMKQNNLLNYEEIYKAFFKGVLERHLGLDERAKKYINTAKCVDWLKDETMNHNFIVLDILDDYKIYKVSRSYVDT